MANVIVSKTVNKVTFDVDRGSYARALKAIQNLKKQWERVNKSFGASNKINQAGRAMDNAAQRAGAAQRREIKRTADYQRQQARRIRDAVNRLTEESPGRKANASYYGELERQSRAAATNAARVERQNAAMNRRAHDQALAENERRGRRARARAEEISRRNARRTDTIGNTDLRLRTRYGADYANRLGSGVGGGINRLNQEFQAGNISAARYRASVAALESQFRSASASAGSFGGAIGNLRAEMTGLIGLYGAFNAAKGIMETGQFFQGLEASMLMVSDNSTEAGNRIDFVRNEASRLGLDLKIASQGFVQMAVAADGVISKTDLSGLFTGFSEYATALQVDPIKYQRGITAIGQMLNKQQIMAEELKGQLAEGIPGAMNAFVKAAQEFFHDPTIGTKELFKLMKDGKLLSKDILPLVGKYFSEAANKGGALQKALEGNRVAMQRMTLAWMDFQEKIFASKFGEQLTTIFNNIAFFLGTNGELAEGVGGFVASFMEGFWDMINLARNSMILLEQIIIGGMKKIGVDGGPVIAAVLDWAPYVAGIFAFLQGAKLVLATLRLITGLSAGLWGINGALAAISASATGALGLLGRFGLAGAGVAGAVAWAGYVDQHSGPKTQLSDNGQYYKDSWVGSMVNALSPSPTVPSPAPFAAGGSQYGGYNPYAVSVKTEPVKVEVSIKDEGKLQGMFDATVQGSHEAMLNMLTAGGE